MADSIHPALSRIKNRFISNGNSSFRKLENASLLALSTVSLTCPGANDARATILPPGDFSSMRSGGAAVLVLIMVRTRLKRSSDDNQTPCHLTRFGECGPQGRSD